MSVVRTPAMKAARNAYAAGGPRRLHVCDMVYLRHAVAGVLPEGAEGGEDVFAGRVLAHWVAQLRPSRDLLACVFTADEPQRWRDLAGVLLNTTENTVLAPGDDESVSITADIVRHYAQDHAVVVHSGRPAMFHLLSSGPPAPTVSGLAGEEVEWAQYGHLALCVHALSRVFPPEQAFHVAAALGGALPPPAGDDAFSHLAWYGAYRDGYPAVISSFEAASRVGAFFPPAFHSYQPSKDVAAVAERLRELGFDFLEVR
ncbi:hypothetical protein DIPPA_20332 [Diplonema papillatum]|nr:hypothetical protein DIPPA_20332 [Diplonema papillatum]